MENKELKAHLDLIWDMYDRVSGKLLALQITEEKDGYKKIENELDKLYKAIFILGIKVTPWDFDEEDLDYIEKVKEEFREMYP